MKPRDDAPVGWPRKTCRLLVTAVVWIIGFGCFGLLGLLGLGPRTGRYTTLTVLSGSMRPGIPVGAVVLATPQPPRALRVGQIITYAIPVDDHRVVSHRVVKILVGGDQPIFVTKGDANNAPDPWHAQLSGSTMWRVRAVIPGLGSAIHTLRQPIVRRIGIYVLPAVVALWWLVDIWRKHEPSTSPDHIEEKVDPQLGVSS